MTTYSLDRTSCVDAMTGMTIDAELRVGSLVGTGMIGLHSTSCTSIVTSTNIESPPTTTAIFIATIATMGSKSHSIIVFPGPSNASTSGLDTI